MNATPQPVRELLAELTRRGVTLKADGERLKFYPLDAVTPELIEQLRQYKPAIIQAIAVELPCHSRHHEPHHWIDHEPIDDRIRTTCRMCGRFIGYRPAEPSRN